MPSTKEVPVSVIKTIILSFVVLFCCGIGVRAFHLQSKDVKIILANGQEISVITSKVIVSEILEDNHIVLLPDEKTDLAMDSQIEENTTIQITKISEQQTEEVAVNETDKKLEDILLKYETVIEKIMEVEEIIPFETITKDSANGGENTERVIQKGIDGKRKVTYKVKFRGEEEIGREEVSSEILKEPVNRIIQKEAKQQLSSRSGTDRFDASQSELELLARIIATEAGDKYDQQLVGTVIMNRVASGKFPNTISGVVYQSGQYPYVRSTYTSQSMEVAQDIMAGSRYAPENVVFQAQFRQGSGVWLQYGVHYYCYQ